jgi:hypothetical protein
VACALYGFRSEIAALLQRVKRLGREGAEFGEERIAAQIMAQPVDVALKDVAPDEDHPVYVRQRVDALRVELNARVPEDVQKREYLLMLRLAQAQQLRDFQSVWMSIFNSQLEALTAMAAEGHPLELSAYYDLHVARTTAASTPDNPVTPLSFETWASFFVQRQLASLVGRAGAISEQGRDLLTLASQFNWPRFQIF